MEKSKFNIIKLGTAGLWDFPYFPTIPFMIQKIFFMPISIFVSLLFGSLPWKIGENLIIIARANK